MASISISTSIACWSTAWLGLTIVAKGGAKAGVLIWLLLIPSVTIKLLMPGDADCRAALVREVVVVLLLGVSGMAVILTKLTGLTWQVVITVLMGLLAIIMVEGEFNVMAVVVKGLGRIWA